jgi:hypothetical protein
VVNPKSYKSPAHFSIICGGDARIQGASPDAQPPRHQTDRLMSFALLD